MNRCESCGAALTGRYCAECGEKVLEGADLDWRHYLLEELPHAVFDVNGALPRTLISLFARPGELAQAFVSGRRRAFIPPVRLYLFAFIVYEVTRSLMDLGHQSLGLRERASLIDPTDFLNRLMNFRGADFWNDPAVEARVTDRLKWLGEAGTFVISVFVALFQSLVFIRLRRRYLEHLALALNVSTFNLLCAAIGQLLASGFYRGDAWGVEAPLQTALALVALPIYWFFSVRRFYGVALLWGLLASIVMTVGSAIVAMTLNVTIYALLILAA